MNTRKIVRGRIIMVQESRFRLAGIEGNSFLLSLSSWADMDEKTLYDYFDSGQTVLVVYEGEAETGTGIARSINPLRPKRSPGRGLEDRPSGGII